MLELKEKFDNGMIVIDVSINSDCDEDVAAWLDEYSDAALYTPHVANFHEWFKYLHDHSWDYTFALRRSGKPVTSANAGYFNDGDGFVYLKDAMFVTTSGFWRMIQGLEPEPTPIGFEEVFAFDGI
mgnify:FL=1